MAGRPSAVLRVQFEIAKRDTALRGTLAQVREVREHVELATAIARKERQLIDEVTGEAEGEIPPRGSPVWLARRDLLQDEIDELERLRAHVELFINANASLE